MTKITVSDPLLLPGVDLTNCDREPIRILGKVQPHGLLFVLEPDLTISQISANAAALISRTSESLLGSGLDTIMPSEQVAEVRKHLFNEQNKYIRPIPITIDVENQQKHFNGVVHGNPDGLLILELEPFVHVPHALGNFYGLVQVASATLQETQSFDDLCQLIVHEVKRITHFDRVMVYQFDEDGHGTVIAEAVEQSMEPFWGLHYPASDIPQQARQLYVLNWLRLIADVNAQPIDIVPSLHPRIGKPVDQTYCFLRSVSPVHIEYLKNMGVGGSMSISLVREGQLWGLIACHHREPIFVPYEVRTVCEFLGQLFSIQLGTREESHDFQYQVKVKSAQFHCIEMLATEGDYVSRLLATEDILTMTGAQGAALCIDHTIHLIGQTTNEKQVRSIVEWLVTNNSQDVFATHNFSKLFSSASAYKGVGSGLLAITISKGQGSYVMWFRREIIQEVNWAGNPNKPIEIDDNGDLRLMPRKSFEKWQQQVENTSLRWKPYELEAAEQVRNAIIGIVLRNIERLASVNADLAQSNSELDAFAYIASHDLKEPLRGIHNYASFLLEDYESILNEDGVSKLNTLVRLTQRMEDLINSLLHFSRVGRVELAFSETSLQNVLTETLALLELSLQDAGVQIRIPRTLPSIVCDQVRIGEVFNNLIVNAMKYNDKQDKWIEIGYLDETPTVFYVTDNGIGILEKHYETIFRIFKRLHGRDEYSGGTGSGLTIARKIIERHGGHIWVRSIYGQGTTFYFNLESKIEL